MKELENLGVKAGTTLVVESAANQRILKTPNVPRVRETVTQMVDVQGTLCVEETTAGNITAMPLPKMTAVHQEEEPACLVKLVGCQTEEEPLGFLRQKHQPQDSEKWVAYLSLM